MKITYDKKTDAMYIKLNDKAIYNKTRKITDDVLVDYAKNGQVVGVEVLAASKNTALPKMQENIPIQAA